MKNPPYICTAQGLLQAATTMACRLVSPAEQAQLRAEQAEFAKAIKGDPNDIISIKTLMMFSNLPEGHPIMMHMSIMIDNLSVTHVATTQATTPAIPLVCNGPGLIQAITTMVIQERDETGWQEIHAARERTLTGLNGLTQEVAKISVMDTTLGHLPLDHPIRMCFRFVIDNLGVTHFTPR